MNIFEKIVILSVVVMVLIANHSYLPWWLLIFALIFVIVALSIIHLSENSMEWMVFIYVVLALLLVGLLEIVVNMFLARRKNQNPQMVIFLIFYKIYYFLEIIYILVNCSCSQGSTKFTKSILINYCLRRLQTYG